MADEKRIQKKVRVYRLVVVLVFVVLIGRLFFLQVVEANQYQARAAQNSTRKLTILARRGDIFDRNGQVLATTRPVFAITFDAQGVKDVPGVAKKLASLIGRPDLDAKAIEEKVKTHQPPYEPAEILQLQEDDPDTWAIVSRIAENQQDLPGVDIQEEPLRYYPNGPLAGHVLGQVGAISPQELDQFRQYGYGMNDQIGKAGLERVYELWFQGDQNIGLKGKDGFRLIEVNNQNRKVRELPVGVDPVPGNNLVLTLDAKVQQVMEKSLKETIAQAHQRNPKAKAGSAVLIDVRTGAILAMASEPEVNPNDFVTGLKPDKLAYYNDEKLQPQLNRAIRAAYPPGSTFKMITGMAALESGKVTPSSTVTCTGGYWVKGGIKCWGVHGVVDLIKAYAKSCNTYFQWAGERAGIDLISKIAKEFGLGENSGATDWQGERQGTRPSRQWKYDLYAASINRKYDNLRRQLDQKYDKLLAEAKTQAEKDKLNAQKQRDKDNLEAWYKIDFDFYTQWQPYDTYNTSIGQGANEYTPLQLANYVATLANGGNRWKPYLVQRIVSPDGKVLQEFKPQLIQKVSVSPTSMALVRQGMRAVCEPGGTAYSAFKDFPPQFAVAGKTGTAQTGLPTDDKKKDFHGVFVGFAPYDNPQVAIAVYIEYGESGSASAVKVAREVLRSYFGLDKQNLANS
ncbi:MAG: penicillin-binding protein 2 [Clostridia bacterium]|nr:penicillin-binding protein 2 [Clostridia bacterium]